MPPFAATALAMRYNARTFPKPRRCLTKSDLRSGVIYSSQALSLP